MVEVDAKVIIDWLRDGTGGEWRYHSILARIKSLLGQQQVYLK